ncbi:uncharacterized protein LOC122024005 isoform X1 [Zingiber officinale]|uniref:Uncharacterized protein n=1 Tax=Zingiber officinale TaxID=94328 RepID=A0A8J5EY17_ZINOF|nr:uncharacterized protein LOC122024005 isoform X1 [Zingiber officinale]KAG6476680.1 hypothetical protein ZIOFF_065926 [Zingiber officinale]
MGREAVNAAPMSGRRKRSSKDPMAKKLDPVKKRNRGSFPPSIAASGASKSGRFRFCDFSSKESLDDGSKTATGTPRSAPPNLRNVAFNSKITAKAVRRKIGSTNFSKRATTDLEAVDESKQMSTTTPTSSATPPIQASISPEVPTDSSLVTPACFAAGHVIVGVHDRRKCRPRGILSVGGGRELEIPEFNGGVADPIRVSVTPPPPAAASINWLSSPSKNGNLGHCPAEASIDWLLSPGEDEEVPSPELNSPCSETTPSSGVMILRTPTSGDSVSPFSSILDRIAKTSQSKHRERRHSLVEDHVTSAPSLHSSSTKNNNLCQPRPQRHNANRQTTCCGLSFQFGSIETSSNSVDLDRFQHLPPSDNIDQTRMSGYRWLSDDEDDLNCLKEDRASLISDHVESNGDNNQNGHIAAAGFGSVEFVFEAEKTGAKGPIRGPISSAESISMEGIVIAASDDSDWTLSYKNHLFETCFMKKHYCVFIETTTHESPTSMLVSVYGNSLHAAKNVAYYSELDHQSKNKSYLQVILLQ